MDINCKTIEKAYKKLKSSVYFDKTQLILRNAIVEFEMKDDINKELNKIYKQLLDEDEFMKLKESIIQSVSVLSLPKKLGDNGCNIIMNSVPKITNVKELQHFIDMKVEGHILGVMWIMLIGYKIDNSIYEHSYGNRIRKNLINELSDNPTYSPYLFEPYFEQYESWRNKAISKAEKLMGLNQDVVIITMDFRKYYYSIDADREVFDDLYKEAFSDDNEYSDENIVILKRLNDLMYDIIEKYSKLFENEYESRHILPIGFLPSNVIGNWCLKNFDKAVVNGWNPAYYGRYVDDVLIVDKIERNSDIYQMAKNDSLERSHIINFFLKKCSKWRGIVLDDHKNDCKNDCEDDSKFALLQVYKGKTEEIQGINNDKNKNTDNEEIYRVNQKYNVCENNKSKIIVHNDKVKIFYFKSNESDALLTCFKDNISRNISEFRHLPEDEAVFQKDDYSEIYTIDSSDTINKFRGIDGISIDKFELSKFLGKYLRIGGLIQDKIESKFEKDVLKIFNLRTSIENYTAWEKIIEIFVINERFFAIESFVNQIINAIRSIEYSSNDSIFSADEIKKSLFKYLHSAICRCFALVWKREIKELQHRIYEIEDFANSVLNENYKKTNTNRDEYLTYLLKAYCQTGMVDKSVMPINIFSISKDFWKYENKIEVNLTCFKDVLPLAAKGWDSEYKYYPYLVNMFDFNIITCIEQLMCDKPFSEMDEIQKKQAERYIQSNYCIDNKNSRWSEISKLVRVNKLNFEKNVYLISVGSKRKRKIKVAIANVKLNHQNFSELVKDMPNRSYERYHDLSFVVNQAIDQKADMLIMPEAYVPYEWLPTLARTCAKNNLAIITGIEHIKYNNNIYNFTAVILPYLEEKHKCANISFHLKTHYAPSEKEEINGYRLTEVTGDHYELYKWNDCYFPVYCCYELTSIVDRALFQSYADLLIAVEWNRDINYYSNILESLSRDIHCYCIQVNTSNYGDSRITQPTKTEEKDVIRTKGGVNSSILVENIDIGELREFQLKEYALQKKNGKFKSTPPNFNSNVVMKKIKNEDLFS